MSLGGVGVLGHSLFNKGVCELHLGAAGLVKAGFEGVAEGEEFIDIGMG
ncbi:MAG: hypothetical protein Q3M24_19510 [Candidatus Electrothrix aestuarii]|uniref:Uncharacterized protein n=1 Tax=Candidatus Electrothrix aestuarii TaxID=3062594 RepID=A0AAU8LT57_9BACT|nr:hypothetical protein [Candidatus Electrothrix aestuarii]WPD21058.1 MAG: hypothetical protein SD837_12690 [Candidatus Electrothrix sp. GW3-3]